MHDFDRVTHNSLFAFMPYLKGEPKVERGEFLIVWTNLRPRFLILRHIFF